MDSVKENSPKFQPGLKIENVGKNVKSEKDLYAIVESLAVLNYIYEDGNEIADENGNVIIENGTEIIKDGKGIEGKYYTLEELDKIIKNMQEQASELE